VEIPTLKGLTQLMHAMEELQLYSTVSIGSRVAHGMDAMGLLCVLTVRYDDILELLHICFPFLKITC
jgi:hypothetical protein